MQAQDCGNKTVHRTNSKGGVARRHEPAQEDFHSLRKNSIQKVSRPFPLMLNLQLYDAVLFGCIVSEKKSHP